MTTNLTFPTPAQLQEFEAKCRAAFPALDWQMEGSEESIFAECLTQIPNTRLRLGVAFWFDSNSASTAVGAGGELIFRSTDIKGQSLEEAIALLREFLQGYAAALNKALEDRPS